MDKGETKMKGHGLQFDNIDEKHYFLGSGLLGTKEINPTGDWEAFLPTEEFQAKKMESMNCTSYGSINTIETLINFLYKEERNFSERFVGVLAETTQDGNSPHKIAETIRKSGLIDEQILPFDDEIDTWEKYYSPRPMTSKYLRIGLKFLEEYDVKHEWVFTRGSKEEKRDKITEALKRSPVALSVYAWVQGEEGIFYQAGQDNHWTVCYGIDKNGNYKIFDSYNSTKKIYSKDADIGMAKIFLINKKKVEKKGIWKRLFEYIKSFIIRT